MLASTYEGVHQLARELLEGPSDAERSLVFGDNAVAVYGLDPAS